MNPRRSRMCLAVVGVALAVAGCDGQTVAGVMSIEGVRTTPDGGGLVVSYAGGSCDESATLTTTETTTRVDLSVDITTDGGSCDAAGHSRTVSATLDSPLARRQVWYEDRQIIPFDGARLERPTALPSAFVPAPDTSGTLGDVSGAGPTVTDRWTLNWTSDYAPDNAGSPCRPGRGQLQLTFAATDGGRMAPGVVVGHRDLNGKTATVYEQGEQQGVIYTRSVQWQDGGGLTVITSAGACDGDSILSTDELLTLATSLQPEG